jgi:hypothetical protein
MCSLYNSASYLIHYQVKEVTRMTTFVLPEQGPPPATVAGSTLSWPAPGAGVTYGGVVLRERSVPRARYLAGISTGGVVLSTVREAADRDYQLYVLADACADRDAEVHDILTQKIFPRQANVTTVADLPGLLPPG